MHQYSYSSEIPTIEMYKKIDYVTQYGWLDLMIKQIMINFKSLSGQCWGENRPFGLVFNPYR